MSGSACSFRACLALRRDVDRHRRSAGSPSHCRRQCHVFAGTTHTVRRSGLCARSVSGEVATPQQLATPIRATLRSWAGVECRRGPQRSSSVLVTSCFELSMPVTCKRCQARGTVGLAGVVFHTSPWPETPSGPAVAQGVVRSATRRASMSAMLRRPHTVGCTSQDHSRLRSSVAGECSPIRFLST